MTTRNPFTDVIEAPDLATKIVAKDGTDAAGYVTVGDVFSTINLVDPTKTWSDLGGASLDLGRGNWTSIGDGANIWRFADRVFVGAAASQFAGDSNIADIGTSWVSDVANYSGYLPINGHIVVTSAESCLPYGITSAFRTSDTNSEAICFGAHAVSDSINNAWGVITELQREATGSFCIGLEVAARNKSGENITITPNAQQAGIYGLWLHAGANDLVQATANSTAAMVVLALTNYKWNDGIVFMKDALTSGKAITLSSVGTGGAHQLNWYNASDQVVFTMQCYTTSSASWYLNVNDTGPVFGSTSAPALYIGSHPAGVNGLTLYCHAAANPPQMQATGTDTDIDLHFVPKGTGTMRFGAHTASGDVAVSGYITIKDAGGTTRKLAVIT